MSSVDTGHIPVSDWTRTWWASLPSAYRQADAAQITRPLPPGTVARDPMFLDGDGPGWDRTIVSETAEQTVTQLQRTFFPRNPLVPLYLHAWWDMPKAGESSLTIRAVGVTGTTLASWSSGKLDKGEGRRTLPLSAPVPNPFVVTVRITRTNTVPEDAYELTGIVIANQELDEDQELPDPDDQPSTHPLLRYMDGIGSIAGRMRLLSDQMWSGELLGPQTVPNNAVHWLAQMVGLPAGVRNQSPERVRDLLIAMQESGRPAVGTRASLVDVVKGTLVGDKQTMVIPDPRAKHTLIILVAATSIPPKGLDWVKSEVRLSGAVPAGHALLTMIAESTWDAWYAAAGPTWADLEKNARNWNEADSLGVFDGLGPVID